MFVVLKIDFDNDGIVSVIDNTILLSHIMGRINEDDPLYDKTNLTYNKKSLNLAREKGRITVLANAQFRNIVTNASKLIPLDYEYKGYNEYEKDNFKGNNWVIDYYKENNKFPTLAELLEAYNNA